MSIVLDLRALAVAVALFVAVVGWTSLGAAVVLEPSRLVLRDHQATRVRYASLAWAVAAVSLLIALLLLAGALLP